MHAHRYNQPHAVVKVGQGQCPSKQEPWPGRVLHNTEFQYLSLRPKFGKNADVVSLKSVLFHSPHFARNCCISVISPGIKI